MDRFLLHCTWIEACCIFSCICIICFVGRSVLSETHVITACSVRSTDVGRLLQSPHVSLEDLFHCDCGFINVYLTGSTNSSSAWPRYTICGHIEISSEEHVYGIGLLVCRIYWHAFVAFISSRMSDQVVSLSSKLICLVDSLDRLSAYRKMHIQGNTGLLIAYIHPCHD